VEAERKKVFLPGDRGESANRRERHCRTTTASSRGLVQLRAPVMQPVGLSLAQAITCEVTFCAPEFWYEK